jgi:Tetratricopeptide repeat
MNHRLYIAVAFGCCLSVAGGVQAQSTTPAPQQPAQQQKPASQSPAQKPAESNPFPDDTTSVPVVPVVPGGEPAASAPAAMEPSDSADPATTSQLKSDSDPVRSPDDPPPGAASSDSGFSSSLSGTDDVNIPDEAKTGKHRKLTVPDKVHQETAKEDEDVGAFELSRKNWKAALSRFESAVVTDPDNPDVYWGMAEAQRQLRDFAKAKGNYQKVVEYDPDSKHGKEAKKLLKDPELANAPAVSAIPTTEMRQPQQ